MPRAMHVKEKLHQRLRWDAVPGTVPGSLPVLFFGDLSRARVATIGLNPSKQEYLSPKGIELEGALRRFETLRSLGARSRSALTSEQADRAIETMRRYFEPTRPVYNWFRPLEQVMVAFGTSLVAGQAAHLDLVQEATDPVWSKLRKEDREAAGRLLDRDLAFLCWQIETFALDAVVCTSKTVLHHVSMLLQVEPFEEGVLARIRWQVGRAHVNGRDIGVAGWNLPLVRPTGLGAAGHARLGTLLRDQLASLVPRLRAWRTLG